MAGPQKTFRDVTAPARKPAAEDLLGDRVFVIAFSISLGLHLILLIGQWLSWNWLFGPRLTRSLEVVYDVEMAQQELRYLEERLARANTDTVASPAPPTMGEHTQIRIPDRPSLTADHTLSDIMPARSTVVDLTDLVDASHGDPVLLSYFGAIREQIQQTANRRQWLSGSATQGLVYISFDLASNGSIQRVKIITDRSVPSETLQDVALTIVKTAAPFLPFPPSMAEPSKTIVVPLEFLAGS